MKLLRKNKTEQGKTSISGRLSDLITGIMVPMGLFAVCIISFLIFCTVKNSTVTGNITTASGFNQNFKDEIDLKMYCFVSGSSNELPLEEVREAKELAGKLLESTRNRESKKNIGMVLNLCENLENCIYQIEASDNYEDRIHQLESNIYVISQLIEDYVYNYMYIEASALANIQNRLQDFIAVGIVGSVLVMLAIVILSAMNTVKISKSITRPIDELYARVGEIGRGDLEMKTPVEADDEKLSALSNGLEKMVFKLKHQMELNSQEQIKLREMELALIQAQINPHFLYNTLDTIIWLIETGKSEQAEEMVSNLSTYFRSFLSNGKDIITLLEEILHVRSYLEIQQVRYKDILEYEIDADPAFDECLLPKMTLQPVIENAIYHGIKPKRGGGLIKVRVAGEGDRVRIDLTDTGAGISKDRVREIMDSLEDEKLGFGLSAAYKRLKLLFGDSCDFTLESELDVGTRISIKIPYNREEVDI